MNARRLLLLSVTSLELACLVGVFWLGARLLLAEPARAEAPAAEADAIPVASPVSVLDPSSAPGVDRVAFSPVVTTTHEGLAPLHARRRAKGERDFYAAFVELGAKDPAELERSVRTALAGTGPDCEKVAGLRAMIRTDAPAAVPLLASAATDLPDKSGPNAESVPRFALRQLRELAAHDESARRVVDRLASPRPAEQDDVTPRETTEQE